MHKNPYETLKQKKYAKKHNRSLLRVRIKQDICDIVVETTLKLNKRESTFFCQVHCVWETIWTPKPEEKKIKHSNKHKHYNNENTSSTRPRFTLNTEITTRSLHNPCSFPLCKTCQRRIQLLNKVPLVTHHPRKQVFRLLLQKQTSDSGRWWNRAHPKLFSHSSEAAKPAAAWSMPLTLPLGERET